MIDMTMDDDNTIMSGFTEKTQDQQESNKYNNKGKPNIIQNPYSPSRKRNNLSKNQQEAKTCEKKKKTDKHSLSINEQNSETYAQATKNNNQQTIDTHTTEKKKMMMMKS